MCTVSSGSTSATRGSMNSLRRLFLTLDFVSVSTAFAVTSAPVPAVVGMAMRGMPGACISALPAK
jgi:hypothetical protein